MLWRAIEKAQRHDSGGRVRVYAIAMDKRGRIIAEGGNEYRKTHPLQARMSTKEGDSGIGRLHAECRVLIAAKGADVATLVIARVDKDGNVKPGKPCSSCAAIIDWYEKVNGCTIQVIHTK